MFVQRASLIVFYTLAISAFVVRSHSHPSENEEECTCEAGKKSFGSYHIHVLFYPDQTWDKQFFNNTHGSKFARALRKTFKDHFDVPDCDETRLFNMTKLCTFAVDQTGAGGPANSAPFVAPNFAIFVPANRYADVVPWMMANRGDLDFLLHPNSCGFTCSKEDHLLWSMWAGNKWQVRFTLP